MSAARGTGAVRARGVAIAVVALLGGGCGRPPPSEDVFVVKVPVAEALDKPKSDSKVMLHVHAGDVLVALPGDPATFERKGKQLSYRRMRRAAEDHAGLIAAADVVPSQAPTTAYFCELLGEHEGRACAVSLVRIRLPNDDYVVYRPSLHERGLLALVEGKNKASREIQGLSEVSVQTVAGKPWLFVESATRKSESWTVSELAILAPDRSLRTRLTVRLQEVDGREGNRFLRTEAVVENGKLWRRGTSYVLGEDGEPTQHRKIDEELVIPP